MKLGRAIKHQKRQLKAARVIGKFYLLPQEEKCGDGVLPGDKALDLPGEESLILARRTVAGCAENTSRRALLCRKTEHWIVA